MASFFYLHSTVSPSLNVCSCGGRRALRLSRSLRQSRTASVFLKPGLIRSSVSRNGYFSGLVSSSSWRIQTGGNQAGDANAVDDEAVVVGEDSAVFQLAKQSVVSWAYFVVILGVVLFVLNVIWIDSSTGFGKAFVDSIGSLSESHEVFFFLSI